MILLSVGLKDRYTQGDMLQGYEVGYVAECFSCFSASYPQHVAQNSAGLNSCVMRQGQNDQSVASRALVLQTVPVQPLMSRIERKYCLISTSYLAEVSDIFILLHI